MRMKTSRLRTVDGEEVNQVEDPALVPAIAPLALVPATEPILVASSDVEATDNLDFPSSKLLPGKLLNTLSIKATTWVSTREKRKM